MKQFTLLIACCFITVSSFSQYENFDLSKYKLPDMKRHQLDLSFYLNNSYENRNSDENENYTSSDFRERFDVTHSFYQNTRKLQRDYTSQFYSNLIMSKENDYYENIYKERSSYSALSFNLDHRFYLDEDKFFLHLRPGFSTKYTWNKEVKKDDAYKNETIDKNFNVASTLDFGAGWGRIEEIGDLRQAIYILEEFDKHGLLKKVLSDDEILVLATRASQLKNKRYFDSRLHKIYEIKSLDSLIQSMDVLSSSDASYFTILNDMWLYGNEDRYSGNRFQVDFSTTGYYSKMYNSEESNPVYGSDRYESSDTDEYSTASFGVSLDYESYKAIGLKWQRKFLGSVSFIHSLKPNVDADYGGEVYAHNFYRVNLNYAYKWFLNTRTSANMGSRGTYTQYDEIDGYYNSEQYYLGIYGGIYYYLSPRLQLDYSASCGSYYYVGDSDTSPDRFTFSNTLTLSYAIF